MVVLELGENYMLLQLKKTVLVFDLLPQTCALVWNVPVGFHVNFQKCFPVYIVYSLAQFYHYWQ